MERCTPWSFQRPAIKRSFHAFRIKELTSGTVCTTIYVPKYINQRSMDYSVHLID